jgi:hypothetical protein
METTLTRHLSILVSLNRSCSLSLTFVCTVPVPASVKQMRNRREAVSSLKKKKRNENEAVHNTTPPPRPLPPHFNTASAVSPITTNTHTQKRKKKHGEGAKEETNERCSFNPLKIRQQYLPELREKDRKGAAHGPPHHDTCCEGHRFALGACVCLFSLPLQLSLAYIHPDTRTHMHMQVKGAARFHHSGHCRSGRRCSWKSRALISPYSFLARPLRRGP